VSPSIVPNKLKKLRKHAQALLSHEDNIEERERSDCDPECGDGLAQITWGSGAGSILRISHVGHLILEERRFDMVAPLQPCGKAARVRI
jgi:hypothetical protein